MISNRLSGGMGMLAVILLFMASQPALARSKIPYSTITARDALTSIQLDHIETYLDERVQSLVQGSEGEVVRIRRELIEPLTWAGGTPIFHLAYSSASANRLTQAIRSDRMLVRLNTMIIIHSLNDPGSVSLIEKGLVDSSPAVRYWAAKAVSQSISSRLSESEQRSLLRVLTMAMNREKSERVLQRLLVAVVGLNIPEAASRLLDALNKRVALHAVNADMPLGAALEGLRIQFIKTVEGKANGRDVSVVMIRQIATVAYRYLDLSATLLDLDRPNPENQANYREMVKLADAILKWSGRQMPPEGGASVPRSVKSDIASNNWPLIRLRVEEWNRMLTQAPFNLGLVELMVTFPDRP